MKCIITGCALYSEEDKSWIWGDLFQHGDTMALNTKGCFWAHEGLGNRKAVLVNNLRMVGGPVNDVYIFNEYDVTLNDAARQYLGGV